MRDFAFGRYRTRDANNGVAAFLLPLNVAVWGEPAEVLLALPVAQPAGRDCGEDPAAFGSPVFFSESWITIAGSCFTGEVLYVYLRGYCQ